MRPVLATASLERAEQFGPFHFGTVQLAVAVCVADAIEGRVAAVNHYVQAVERPQEALSAAHQSRSIRPLDGERLDFWQTGSLSHRGRRHAEQPRAPLIANDQPAVGIEAHADPRALCARHAIQQLDFKVLMHLDLLDPSRLRRAAVINGRLIVAAALALPLGLFLGRSGGEHQESGEDEESQAQEGGLHKYREGSDCGLAGFV